MTSNQIWTKQFFTGAQNQNGISLKMNLSTVQNVNISWVDRMGCQQAKWKKSWDQKTQDNQRYKMAVIKWPFGHSHRRILKREFHVLEHHRSFQEPDVLWRFKHRTDWYPKKWTWCFTYWGNLGIPISELSW